jgi:hypothetical protein
VECRLGCGACCIAPSISTSFPLHPTGKAAGERCQQLNEENLCRLFGKPERPTVCHAFQACDWICGSNNQQALNTLNELEVSTHPINL